MGENNPCLHYCDQKIQKYFFILFLGAGSSSAKELTNVNCHTVADLVRGKYVEEIASYRIIDARYCYEYQGGHIRGAENFGTWDEDAFMKEFLPSDLGPRESVLQDDEKPHIVIFHCEFSSARGPALMRLLRNRLVKSEINLEFYLKSRRAVFSEWSTFCT